MNYEFNSPITCRGNLEGQRGTATLTAVLILALLGVFTAAAMSRVTTGQSIMNNDIGNSKAFYAAQASLEEMTRNFDNIFTFHLTPSRADLTAVQNATPGIPGFNYNQLVTQTSTSGTQVVIASGPYAGLTSLRDNWRLDATATSWNGPQVHLTREFYNHKIPIFQFGIFYNRDLAIHPGPVMYFSGRVHSNANLFVMAGNGITFTSRVTAVGEVIRDWNRNGMTLSQGGWNGAVNINDPTGTAQTLLPASGGTTYGSVIPGSGTGILAGNPLNPDPGMAPNNDSKYTQWFSSNDSGIFGGNLQAHVPLLQLPIQIGVGLDPIELIKRGINATDYQAAILGQTPDQTITTLSRYCNKPGIRVSLSDTQAELPGSTGGVRLDGASDGLGGDSDADGSRGYKPQAMTDGYQAIRINGFRLYSGQNYPNNGNGGTGANIPANRQTWIKVELVTSDSSQNIVTTDVTKDFLSMGMTDVAPDLLDPNAKPLGDSRAILKIQRYEIPGAPARVADVNVADGTSPNTLTGAQAASGPPGVALPSFTGLAPTTANYVYSPPGSGKYIAVGPFNVYTYQPTSGTVGQFSYVSMTNNNYTTTLAGSPSSTTLNGYSVLTNLHSAADGTLSYFNGATLSQLSSKLGYNVWGTNAQAYGTATALPVSVNGFTSAPAYPNGYNLSNTVVPPSFKITIVGAAGNTFTLSFGGQTTAAIAFSTTPATMQSNIQTAVAALTSLGSSAGERASNFLIGGISGAGTTASPYVVTMYFSNPSLATNALTNSAEKDSSGNLSGSVSIAYSAGNMAPASIEGVAHGRVAQINAATARTETVVPFPIEIFNPREGVYSGDMTFDPTGATTNPNWYSLYANGSADKTKNGGTVPTWAGSDLPVAGVMSLIDVDVTNLKSFLMGADPTKPGAWDGLFANGLASTQIPTNPGWILYVSDRRGDRDDDGEYDMEDIYGPVDGTLQAGEDANLNGRLDVDIQGTLSPNPFGLASNSPGSEAVSFATSVPTDIAAFFDHQYFRRGVRLINGSQLPGDEFNGFTLATENPAYTLGNYNATGIAAGPINNVPTPPSSYIPAWDSTGKNTPANTATTQVPASIAADGVWILSVVWKDGGSFRWPMNSGSRTTANNPAGNSMETAVRTAFFMGSTQGSILAKPNQGGGDACLDGGVHNFPRFLESWNTRLNYCGSLINPFYSRQAVGAHKTGGPVYGPPTRNWTFDSSFLDITRCPPGTPLFQFVQTTGFRQTTRQET
jgi:hypothetical protein